ncbi:MAG: peptidase [Thermoplasmata archaeon]|nr:peptidase [Thermoplasmata archaeon]
MEILSPAGNPAGLVAAVKGGCDAVYLGGKTFGARAYAGNFSDQQLEGAVSYCHDHGVKVHVTVNTLIKDSEMSDAVSFVRFLKDIHADAVLIQDLGLLKSLHSVDIRKHASTQMGIHSAEGLEWCAENGISRAVLARELTFDELKEIVPSSPIETEVFIAGALCYCISGGCLFSSVVGGRSGNRGSCAQPCRKKFRVGDEESFRLSNADLYGVDWLPKLESIGVTSAKIEGRMRSEAYAYLSAKVYSSANKGLPESDYAADVELLKTVFNRGYCSGYLGGVVSPVQVKYADNRGFFLGKAKFRNRKFDTAELKEPVGVRDGISLYADGVKVGGFKLSSLGKTACPFDIPDGTYEVYRTYDPRIDEIKNLVGDPPRFTGTTERKPVRLTKMESGRRSVKRPELSFYVASLKVLNAVLPYADRVYYEYGNSFDDARKICDDAGVEFVAIMPRFSPAGCPAFDGPVMINSPGQYRAADGQRVYGSYLTNIFNSRSEYPFYQVTLSTELSKHEISDIAASYPGRIEVMAFGRIELMCTRDPSMTNGEIVDEKGYRFPTYRDNGGTARILNSSDLFLLPYLQQLGKIGVDSVGIDLRKRPEGLAKLVARAFAENDVSAKDNISGMCGGLNTGAYNRGTD